MKTLRFFLCVTIIISAFIFYSCDRNDQPEQVQLGEIGVYCVLEQGWGANQQRVILKRVPLPGEPEIYTSVKGAQVRISIAGKVYEFSETSTPGMYTADFYPQVDKLYKLEIVTQEGEHITSTMTIPSGIRIRRSSADSFPHKLWTGPLNNALYPGLVITSINDEENYYVLIKGQASYDGKTSNENLKYWATNHTGADPVSKVGLESIEAEMDQYGENAFSYPDGDPSLALSFYKDYILVKNPYQFNSNRLLGTNYRYIQDGEEYWDNGFILTAGPFVKFPESAKVPLLDMSSEAISAFGRDYCETYSLKLTFVQMSDEFVNYFKDVPGFPNVQYDQSYVFKKDGSNINGGVGIFTYRGVSYNYNSDYSYTNDIHNKEFREYFLESKKDGYNELEVNNQKSSECLGKDQTKASGSMGINIITLEAKGDKLFVYRKGQYNCGAKIELAARKEGNTIILEEVNTRGYAYCGHCIMDSSCEIGGLEEDVYIISVQDDSTQEFYDPIRFHFKEGEKVTVDFGSKW